MKASATLRYIRIAPRKLRLIADLIRGKRAAHAQTILHFITKRGAKPIFKLLQSALASARTRFQLDPSSLYISRMLVDEGPKLKRFRPRARGKAYEIQKKTSHITIVLDEIEPGKTKKVLPVQRQKVSEDQAIGEKKIKSWKPTRTAFEREAERPKRTLWAKRIFQRKTI
ncbi:MAG: 50S ribosomal protein L22 [Patescibacteria group bacterium]